MADPSQCLTRTPYPCLQRYPRRVRPHTSIDAQLWCRGVAKLVNRITRSVNLPELTKSQIWLSNSNRKMWNIARVPRPSCDVHTAKPYLSSPDARSITVLIHDFFYVVEVYDESCKPHSPGIIERSLWSCVRDVERRLASGERAKPIGILTTDDRDQWAEVGF